MLEAKFEEDPLKSIFEGENVLIKISQGQQGSTNSIFVCIDFHARKIVLCAHSCTQITAVIYIVLLTMWFLALTGHQQVG